MHVKRWLSLAGVAVAAAVLITTAGAAQRPTAKTHVNFKTPAAVLKYLQHHGVNVRGMVVQRGLRNYAGPTCPGKAWHCTRARHVIQFHDGGGDNAFKCSPSYGTPSSPYPPNPGDTLMPNTCVVVQVNTNGNNNATCTERSSAPDVSQECQVWQENVSGNNRSTISQVIDQENGQSQTGSQDAQLTQFNNTGKNDSDLSQTIRQATNAPGPSVGQDQSGRQTNSIDQEASLTAGGAQNSSMSQSVNQLAQAGGEGGDHATLAAFGLADEGGPVSGSQSQFGDGRSDTSQSSSGVSKSDNDQTMKQRELAPKNSTGLTQFQNGPFRCCTFQGTNPKDKFTLKQSKLQFASTLPQTGGGEKNANTLAFFSCDGPCPSGQTLSEKGHIDTSGKGSIRQFANQNGTQSTNSCNVTNGPCFATLACANGNCPPPTHCSGVECGDVSFSLASSRHGAAHRQRSNVYHLRVHHLR
ncbi:MAG: hypothetical protein M3R39_04250 [Actinomycetota bacterium]|nr:hypothetical protein [Actinomycetota bacterium]